MPSPDPPPTSLASDLRRLNWPRPADDLNDLIAQATQRRWSPTVLLERVVAARARGPAAPQRRTPPLRRAPRPASNQWPDWDWDWPTALDRRALERVLALGLSRAPRQCAARRGARPRQEPCSPRTSCTPPCWPATPRASRPPRTSSSISTGKKPRGPSTAACSTIPGPHCSPSMRSDISRTMPAPRTSSFRSSVVATSIARS